MDMMGYINHRLRQPAQLTVAKHKIDGGGHVNMFITLSKLHVRSKPTLYTCITKCKDVVNLLKQCIGLSTLCF